MTGIDVIVPCYRYGRFLRECVDSILSQQVNGLRVLIIDDASPDETPEIAEVLRQADSRITVIRHGSNRGIIDTLNEGVEWASSKYMLIISADDLLFPGALARAVQLMDQNETVGFTCGRALEVRESVNKDFAERQNDEGYRILSGREFLDLSDARNIVYAPTAVVRTNLQKRVGGYHHALPHSADTEMWFRLAAHADVGVVKAYQAVYRIHGANFSLAYAARGGMPDFQQRHAAIHCFIEACSSVLPNPEQRRGQMIRSLGIQAIDAAGSAFDKGELDIAEELFDFAVRIHPEVRSSLATVKYICKRTLGLRGCRLVRPLASTVRLSLEKVRSRYKCEAKSAYR